MPESARDWPDRRRTVLDRRQNGAARVFERRRGGNGYKCIRVAGYYVALCALPQIKSFRAASNFIFYKRSDTEIPATARIKSCNIRARACVYVFIHELYNIYILHIKCVTLCKESRAVRLKYSKRTERVDTFGSNLEILSIRKDIS